MFGKWNMEWRPKLTKSRGDQVPIPAGGTFPSPSPNSKAARELKPGGLWDELPGGPVPFVACAINAAKRKRFHRISFTTASNAAYDGPPLRRIASYAR
jgi:hypothetical protein